MVSGPMISWQIEGEKVEAATDFTFLDFKITVDTPKFHGEILTAAMKLKDACSLEGELSQT